MMVRMGPCSRRPCSISHCAGTCEQGHAELLPAGNVSGAGKGPQGREKRRRLPAGLLRALGPASASRMRIRLGRIASAQIYLHAHAYMVLQVANP
jgi:hypothetical protein